MGAGVHDAFAEDAVEVVEVVLHLLHQLVELVAAQQLLPVHPAQVVHAGLLIQSLLQVVGREGGRLVLRRRLHPPHLRHRPLLPPPQHALDDAPELRTQWNGHHAVPPHVQREAALLGGLRVDQHEHRRLHARVGTAQLSGTVDHLLLEAGVDVEQHADVSAVGEAAFETLEVLHEVDVVGWVGGGVPSSLEAALGLS